MTIWDQFDRGASADGSYPDRFKFENPGDSIAGTVTLVKTANFGEGPQPELYVAKADGETVSIIASQAQLRAKLAGLRPGVGDGIAITFTHIENRGGGKTLKHFAIDHNPAAPSTGTATAAAAPAAAAPAPVAAPAASDLL